MPKTTTPVRERLIESGLDFFYKDGFHATALDRILESAQTTKTTFYNHFESKDDLALACIQARDARWRGRFPELLQERAGSDPIAQLNEVFNLWQDWFNDIHFKGCLFIHACSEFPNPNEPCHIAARANTESIREMIANLATEAGITNPHLFAQRYFLVMQGAIVMEVIDRKNEAAATAANIAGTLLKSELENRCEHRQREK